MAEDQWDFGSGRDLWDTSELYEVDSIEGEMGSGKGTRRPLIKLAHSNKTRLKRPKPFGEPTHSLVYLACMCITNAVQYLLYALTYLLPFSCFDPEQSLLHAAQHREDEKNR